MNAKWLSNLKGEGRENRRAQVLSAKNVLDILDEIVYNMLKDEENVTAANYDCPSWSHLQAHKNGRAEALRQVLLLTKIDGKE